MFSTEHRKQSFVLKKNLLISLGMLGGGFYFTNKMLNFKVKSSLITGAVLFGLSYQMLSTLSTKYLNSSG